MNKDIVSLSKEEITSELLLIGEPKFRAAQIFDWIHKKNVSSFDDMINLPAGLRKKLSDSYELMIPKPIEKFLSKRDNTQKYLFDIGNNNIIESVLMEYDHGNSACISSQAGCRMGCTFCASGINGLSRNLTASEMAMQVYGIQKESNEKISSVVIMGIGEPLDNFDNVIKFIKIINSKDGQNIGMRHITLSTCGIIDKIKELCKLNLQITLAVSLHAPNNEIRESIMPISRKNNFNDLIEVCRYYSNQTKRRITFEYALIEGVNDGINHALELSKALKGLMCHVNLIGVNEVEGKSCKTSTQMKKFADALKKNNINVTIRRKLGGDIDAACGQLRHKYYQKEGAK